MDILDGSDCTERVADELEFVRMLWPIFAGVGGGVGLGAVGARPWAGSGGVQGFDVYSSYIYW
jgi:hypothetical protein